MDYISFMDKAWCKVIDQGSQPWKTKSLIKKVTVLKWDHARQTKN